MADSRAPNSSTCAIEVDWTGCDLVEQIPGKVSGKPIVRGTRILADTIVQDAQLGSALEEIHENYPDLTISEIEQPIHFARVAETRVSTSVRATENLDFAPESKLRVVENDLQNSVQMALTMDPGMYPGLPFDRFSSPSTSQRDLPRFHSNSGQSSGRPP